MGMSGERHNPAALYPTDPWTGEWVDLIPGLCTEATVRILCQGSNPSRPACCQTLYWLNYPNSILQRNVVLLYIRYLYAVGLVPGQIRFPFIMRTVNVRQIGHRSVLAKSSAALSVHESQMLATAEEPAAVHPAGPRFSLCHVNVQTAQQSTQPRTLSKVEKQLTEQVGTALYSRGICFKCRLLCLF
jgi:hypothetical protein